MTLATRSVYSQYAVRKKCSELRTSKDRTDIAEPLYSDYNAAA